MPTIIKMADRPDPLAQLLGERVRSARRRAGMTQAQLSDATGVNPAYVSLIERGRVNPTLDTMVRLGGALGMEPWQLIHPTGALEEDVGSLKNV